MVPLLASVAIDPTWVAGVKGQLIPFDPAREPAGDRLRSRAQPGLGWPPRRPHLDCMHFFAGRTPAQEILDDLPDWEANGSVYADIAAAARHIATATAAGQHYYPAADVTSSEDYWS